MRPFIYQFVILSVLFMSAEGAFDMMIDGHPHDDNLSQQVDTNSNTDTEQDATHCEHCCHGHLVSIGVQHASMALVYVTGHQRRSTPHVLNHDQAPPTPPPNA